MLAAIASIFLGGVVRTFFSERFSFASLTVWVIYRLHERESVRCTGVSPDPDTLPAPSPLSFPAWAGGRLGLADKRLPCC